MFAYFKDLSMYVNIPGDIMDKEIIEYHGSRDKKPVLKLRIVPGMKEFKSEEMRQVYKGIYVKEKVLFEGEDVYKRQGMMYPELVKEKYPEGYAAALPVAGGTL